MGDWAARTVADRQPVKLAAFEGLANTEKGAEFTIGGIYEDGELKYGISIPKLLSLLADHDPNGVVEGLNTVPKDDQPPVNPVHLSFQVMVGIGTGPRRPGGRVPAGVVAQTPVAARTKWFYRAVVAAGPAGGGGAHRGLDHHRGGPPAVGGL